MKLPSIHKVLKESTETFFRFPLVIIVATIGTVAALILVDFEGPPGPSVLFNILFAAILGISLLLGIALTIEKRGWGGLRSLTLQGFGILLLVGYAISVPSDLPSAPGFHLIRLMLLAVVTHLFVATVPYLGRGEIVGFWQYNKELFLRILIACVFSLVLYAGLAIALAALDNLFGINISGRRYAELGILITGIFTTWFFLAGVPKDFKSLDTSFDYPKGVKVFAQYILLPLVFVYCIILYAYLTKILVAWDWPQGWVARLILGYSVTGIFSLLLLYPIRNRDDNFWMITASRWFYVIMIPLVIMYLLALVRRTSEYGITEDRYIALAVGGWLIFIVTYFIFSKTKNIKLIPGSLCVAALLVSYGPWGAFAVSINSQVERLESLLAKNSILVEGKVQKVHKAVPLQDTKQISSILAYMHDIHGYDRIQPWFQEMLTEDSSGNPARSKSPSQVAQMIGIEYMVIQLGATGNEVVMNVDQEGVSEIAGYDRMLPRQYIDSDRLGKSFTKEAISYSVSSDLGIFTLKVLRVGGTEDSLQVDIRKLIDKLLRDYENANAGNIPPDKMTAANENQSLKAKILVRHLRVQRRDGKVKPVYYDADIMYSLVSNKNN